MEFTRENIIFDVQGETKLEILSYAAKKAKNLGICEDEEGLLEDLLKREDEFSTGLNEGFAIPHARSQYVKKISILFLKTMHGIDWKTLDDSKIKYLFVLLVPEENENNIHLSMISKLATCLLDSDFKESIKSCIDKDKLKELICNGMS